jgi:CcmD family protein
MIYLAAAFIAVWVVVTAYLVYMGNRQRQLEQEMQTLEEMLADQQKRKS